MDTDMLERESTYLYSIRGYPHKFFWTGKTAGGLQVLVVICYPRIVTTFFDPQGKFVDVQERILSESTRILADKHGIREAFERQDDPELVCWLLDLGFLEDGIKVRKFFLPNYHIGIRDFPRYYSQVLCSPSEYNEDERNLAREAIAAWPREGLFELWLNDRTDVWVNRSGHLDAS